MGQLIYYYSYKSRKLNIVFNGSCNSVGKDEGVMESIDTCHSRTNEWFFFKCCKLLITNEIKTIVYLMNIRHV